MTWTHRLCTKLDSKVLSEGRCLPLSRQLMSAALNRLPMEKADAEKLAGDMTKVKTGL